MTTRDVSPAPAPEQMTACPGCGRAVAVPSEICRFCWHSLIGVAADPAAAARALAAEARRRHWVAQRRRLPLAITVMAVLALFWWWYPREVTVPAPSTPAREVVAASERPTTWPMDDGDAARTRATAARPPVQGREAWRARLDSPATTRPVAGSEAVYIGVRNAALVALSALDGRELWRSPVVGQLDAAPTLAGDRLYLGLRDGSVAALDARDGRQVWRAGSGGNVATSPVVSAGVVYVASGRGDVRALDAEDGRELWSREAEGAVASLVPIVAGDGVIAVTSVEATTLFGRSSGQALSYYRLRQPVAALAYGQEVIVVGRTIIASFGVEQRRPWWEPLRMWWGQFWLQGMLPEPPAQPSRWAVGTNPNALAPAIAGETLVVAYREGAVRGLDMATGEQRWTAMLGRMVAPPIATAAGVLLVEAEALVLLDGLSGAVIARRALTGERLSAIAPTADAIYLISRETEVITLR